MRLLALSLFSIGLLSAAPAEPSSAAKPAPSKTSSAPEPPGEMVTDRPDFTESASTVPQDWVQLETGLAYSWERGSEGKSRSLTLPYPLLRMGLSKRLELRVSADGYARNRFFNEQGQSLQHGLSDFEVGFKYAVLAESPFLPQVAVIAGITEPYGHSSLSSGTVDPKSKICWSKDLPQGWGLSGNFNYFYLRESGQRFLERDSTVSLSHDLPYSFSGYVEAYNLANITLDGQSLNVFQAGWSRQLRGRIQFDMSVARSLGAPNRQWSVMAGFSYRAPWGPRAFTRN